MGLYMYVKNFIIAIYHSRAVKPFDPADLTRVDFEAAIVYSSKAATKIY